MNRLRPPRLPVLARIAAFTLQAGLLPAALAGSDPVLFPQTAEQITAGCARALEDHRAAVRTLVADARTDFSWVAAFAADLAVLDDKVRPLSLMMDVHPDEAVRTAAQDCATTHAQYATEVFSSKRLYQRLLAVAPGSLGRDEKVLLERFLRDFRRNGATLDEAALARYTALQDRLSALTTAFSARIYDEDPDAFIMIPAAECGALPPAIAEGLRERNGTLPDGSCKITTAQEDVDGFFRFSKNSELKRRLSLKIAQTGGTENVQNLEEILRLRRESAVILGYGSYAEFFLEAQMARDPATVANFLERFAHPILDKQAADIRQLYDFKRVLEGPNSVPILDWDRAYYSTLLKKDRFTVDIQGIRDYFPADVVIGGAFRLYEDLLGIRIRNVPMTSAPWAPRTRLFEIRDRGDGPAQPPIAYFYTDLFEREDKATGMYVTELRSGRADAKGGYVPPVALLLGNLPTGNGNRPGLLNHSDVVTLLHELGHVIHVALTRVPYAYLAGIAVPRDFEETPSQMLENWAWDRYILRNYLSGHVDDHARKLPDAQLAGLLQLQTYQQGVVYAHQLLIALVDQAYHGAAPVDTTAAWNDLQKRVRGYDALPGAIPQAGIDHFADYGANYYGYLWSEVYSAAMFTAFGSGRSLVDPAIGARYRREILEKGGLRSPDELVRAFLGKDAPEELQDYVRGGPMPVAPFLRSHGFDR